MLTPAEGVPLEPANSDSDKKSTWRLIIVGVLAIVALVVVQLIFSDDEEEIVEGEDVQLAAEAEAGGAAAPAAEPTESADTAEPGADAAPADAGGEPQRLETAAASAGYGQLAEESEDLVTVRTDLAVIRLSDLGGAYKSVTLLEHKDYDGSHLTLFNKIPGEYYPGMITVEGFTAWTEYNADRPPGEYRVSGDDELTITYTATAGQVTVTKRFTFRGDSYVGYLDVSVAGVPATARNVVLELGTGLDRQGDMTNAVRGQLTTIADVGGDKFEESAGDNDDESEDADKIGHIAVNDNHFTLALKPTGEGPFFGSVALREMTAPPKIARTTLTAQASDGGLFRRRFLTYIGPKYHDALDALGMGEVADFGWNFLAPVSIGLLKLLKLFYSFLGNYGLAIILMTIAIKLVLMPLTNKSFRSSIAMQMLQPKIEAIKERYANDQQRANEEIMALYKKNKVSPLGGCLPLLLQMPVFIALFGALRNAVELRGAAFLWISDLTLPDALFSWGVNIPLIGPNFNLLPLLMVAVMWYQGRMTAKRGGKTTGFTKFMPIIFGVLFYQMPSGLVLYWLFNSLLTVAQQYWLLKVYQKEHGISDAAPAKSEKEKPARVRGRSVAEAEAAKSDKKKRKKPQHEVACEKCGHKTDWNKTLRAEFRDVELRTGGKGDVDGVYCPRCGAALGLAVDDDDRYALAAADPEEPIPPLEDRDWGRFLPKKLVDRSHYSKVQTK